LHLRPLAFLVGNKYLPQAARLRSPPVLLKPKSLWLVVAVMVVDFLGLDPLVVVAAAVLQLFGLLD